MAGNRLIVCEGTDLKFRIMCSDSEIDLSASEWTIKFVNRHGQKVGSVSKDDSFVDAEGNFYFTHNAHSGKIYALISVESADEDFASKKSVLNERSLLYATSCDLHSRHDLFTRGNIISYERVWMKDVGQYIVLMDRDGTPILDRDGNAIYVRRYRRNS